MSLLFSISAPSSSFVPMAVLKPRCVESQDYYYEALAFCRHSINLKLNVENMKAKKATMAPRNAGINPREPDRASDKNSLTGTGRPSYQARELIGDDDERLAMRQGDMLHRYLNELPIRVSEKVDQYRIAKGTRRRCTVPPPKTPTQEHSLIIVEVSSHRP